MVPEGTNIRHLFPYNLDSLDELKDFQEAELEENTALPPHIDPYPFIILRRKPGDDEYVRLVCYEYLRLRGKYLASQEQDKQILTLIDSVDSRLRESGVRI